jgi:hypothetical protein
MSMMKVSVQRWPVRSVTQPSNWILQTSTTIR